MQFVYFMLSGKWRQHKSPQNSQRCSDKAPPESLCLAELSEPRSEELGHLQCRPPLQHLQHQPSAPAWHGPRSGQRHLPGGVSVRPTFEWWAGMMEQGWPTFNKARLKIEKVLGLNDATWIRGKELMDMDLNVEMKRWRNDKRHMTRFRCDTTSGSSLSYLMMKLLIRWMYHGFTYYKYNM